MLFDTVIGTQMGLGRILKAAKALFKSDSKRVLAHASQKKK